MKKSLLLLACALVASFSLVSHAGGPGSGFGGGFQMPSDPIDIMVSDSEIVLGFYPGYVNQVSLRNINTGESYVRNYTPSRCVVDIPWSCSNGTWVVSASGDDGTLYYRKFAINRSSIPSFPDLTGVYFTYNGFDRLVPMDWVDEENPVIWAPTE